MEWLFRIQSSGSVWTFPPSSAKTGCQETIHHNQNTNPRDLTAMLHDGADNREGFKPTTSHQPGMVLVFCLLKNSSTTLFLRKVWCFHPAGSGGGVSFHSSHYDLQGNFQLSSYIFKNKRKFWSWCLADFPSSSHAHRAIGRLRPYLAGVSILLTRLCCFLSRSFPWCFA